MARENFFVVSMIPLMKHLEEGLTGIRTDEGRNHKIKLFADDIKILLGNLSEIETAYNVIGKFEGV